MNSEEKSWSALHRTNNDDGTRLSDLIPALKLQHGAESEVLQRVDPAIIEELRPYIYHRHVDLMDLTADCLELLSSDATDTIGQLGVEQHAAFHRNPEAALLCRSLKKALHSRLQREFPIGSATILLTVFIRFSRCGHPHTMA